MMSHTGGKEGTYPGTRASATMIGDDETNWGTKSLAKPPMRLFHPPECLITDLALSFGDPQLATFHPRQPLTIRREDHGVRRRWIGVVFG